MGAILGIDVGASTISGGLVTDEGEILTAVQAGTHERGQGTAMETLQDVADRMVERARRRGVTLGGIGIGLPGLVHVATGRMVDACNLVSELAHVPLADRLAESTGLPVFVDNDVNALALGEWMFGAGRGERSLAVLALGTGGRARARGAARAAGGGRAGGAAGRLGRRPRLRPALLESELFGHVRGAFTGAIGERRGLFEEADGGTIFLDEVGEMSAAMQLKLLRVLQEGELRRVGTSATRRVDVRVIAATNVELEAAVETGRFRKDLYYRLAVFPVRLPPLRERPGDIPVLAAHFLRLTCRRARRFVPGLSAEALRCLRAYPFPGNVRELQNEIERALMLADPGRPIGLEHLSARIQNGAAGAPTPLTLNEAIEQLKRGMIEDALRECGSKTRAAERLGLSRQSLQQMLRRRQG